MHIFVIDDCNNAWDDRLNFFMYGGIVVPESEMLSLAREILNIKNIASVPKERPLKWSNNKWKNRGPLDEALHAKLKNDVLYTIASSRCKIIICLSPQRFYHRYTKSGLKVKMRIDPNTQKRTQQYALNDALGKFQDYLKEVDQVGMVLADRFGDSLKIDMDQHCFSMFPNNSHTNIVHPVIQVENEYSHLHQINDIVLGAVYFSLREMGHNFLPILRNNFWTTGSNDFDFILGRGFNIFPLLAKVNSFKVENQRLKDKFLRLVKSV